MKSEAKRQKSEKVEQPESDIASELVSETEPEPGLSTVQKDCKDVEK